jgi:hypothetical protein
MIQVSLDFEDKYNGLFAKDDVHLSFIGYDIFINTLQGALESLFVLSSLPGLQLITQ